ncbi:MAG: type IV pilus modification protein PilV [Magnetococcales bacterium]|nr:type IV pilus modification protein PilV [Magnetococcales bacterium]
MLAVIRNRLPVHRRSHASDGEAGFSLLEILMTLTLLSIGFLGIAKLQFTSLRYTQSSMARSQAAVLADDILDRMRANRDVAQDTDVADDDCLYAIALAESVTDPPDCINGTCTAANMASFDLSEWKTAVADALPSGDGSVSRNGSVFTITVQWDDSRGQQAAATFTSTSEL